MTGTTSPPANRGQSGRRGLSPALIAFIVLDVVLVVAAVLLGLSLGSDDSPAGAQSSATPTSTSDGATSDGASPTPSATPLAVGADAKQVASPTGNITCTLSPEGAECAIASLATEPAAVDGCEGTVGYVATLTTSGVQTPCMPEKPGKADAAIPVLAYGDTESVNNFACESTESGMKCSDTNTGKGFTLARAGITRF
ncbi:hypothetical protein SAMN05216410_2085 [Sanguibacter gelidistatuariae]|uniref:Uncharacterized protein n=1 Tax=Sanguibacter gelidistatuariae TaxID=1814289 RepID=A0A1G6N8Q7_9MICO|nr:hypothetical protein [Sanguibacter gelidistatuariae]SDC64219.1 hypothetical protein SAMN05216410_2085 [Sanguibacter gelidistatuariae]